MSYYMEKKCLNCGVIFKAKGKEKFCSRNCSITSKKTPETLKKMSIAAINRWNKEKQINDNFKTIEEIFEHKAKKIHGDKYNYKKVIYTNAMKKVIITCKIHGDFLQKPNDHLSGYGCRKCGLLLRRKKHINRIKENYGTPFPNFNKKACEFFKEFDENNNTKGKYALYGGGEYFIEQFGYWLDYINFDLKLIIEWNEKYHYDKNGNLKKRDLQRKEEIISLFHDFEFRIIKDE